MNGTARERPRNGTRVRVGHGGNIPAKPRQGQPSGARKAAYEDLLAVPFRNGGENPLLGLDCYGQAKEINRRLGHPLPCSDRTERGLLKVGDKWQDATELGDIIVSDPELTGELAHCSTVVSLRETFSLSCSERQGAYAIPARRISRVVGVWRSIQ